MWIPALKCVHCVVSRLRLVRVRMFTLLRPRCVRVCPVSQAHGPGAVLRIFIFNHSKKHILFTMLTKAH